MSRTMRRDPPRLARPDREDERGNVEPYAVAVQRKQDEWCNAVWAHAESAEGKRRAILADCFSELALNLAHAMANLFRRGYEPSEISGPLVVEARFAAEQYIALDSEGDLYEITWALLNHAASLAQDLLRNGAKN